MMKIYTTMFIMTIAILLLFTLPFAYYYYDSDIERYEKAMKDEVKLLDPTSEDVKAWERKNKLIEIEEKKRELYYIEHDLPLPDSNIDEYINHILTYPEGHNPPKHQIQKLIDEVKEKRKSLIIWAGIVSVLISIIIISYSAYKNYETEKIGRQLL